MKTLPALTGVRFVAALLVVLFHFVRVPDVTWLNNLFAEGQRGVEFFFVLSGFVLGYNYFPRAATLSKQEFWAARVARIVPLYWLSLVVSLPLLGRLLYVDFGLDHAGAASYGLLFSIVTVPMLQTLTPLSWLAQGWNTPAWSLSLEAICYLLFPSLVVLAQRLNRRQCLAIATTCVVVLFAFDWVLPHLPQEGKLLEFSGRWLYRITPLYNFPMFLTGVVLSRVFLLTDAQAITLLPRNRAAVSAASVVISALTLAFFTCGWSLKVAPLTTGLSVALFAVIIYLLAHGCGPVAAVLSRPFLMRLGDASFALYLLQAALKTYVQQFYSKVLGMHDVQSLEFNLSFLLIAIVVSLLAHRFFEVPARKRLKDFLTKHAQRAVAVAGHRSAQP
jgi:peptidoglycan/LPS O-acetylase OafA/YrhL